MSRRIKLLLVFLKLCGILFENMLLYLTEELIHREGDKDEKVYRFSKGSKLRGMDIPV